MPELQKIEQAGDAYGAVIEFLDWIDQHPDLCLGEWQCVNDASMIRETPLLRPRTKSAQAIVYEYFGIDPQALEKERRELLASFRAAGEYGDPEPPPAHTPDTIDLMEAIKASLAAEQKRRG